MPKCVVKNCTNHNAINLKKHGVTYHRFPQNYIVNEKWRKLIATNRGEEFFAPNKHSVVCSYHFSESDMYYTKKGFKRIKNNVIPRLQIEETPNLTLAEHPDVNSILELGTQESDMDVILNLTKSAQADACPEIDTSDEANLCSTIHKEYVANELGASSISTDLSEILETPKTLHLKNELKKCQERIAKKNIQIRNLRKQNKRLLISNLTLKELLKDKQLSTGLLCSRITNTDKSIMAILG